MELINLMPAQYLMDQSNVTYFGNLRYKNPKSVIRQWMKCLLIIFNKRFYIYSSKLSKKPTIVASFQQYEEIRTIKNGKTMFVFVLCPKFDTGLKLKFAAASIFEMNTIIEMFQEGLDNLRNNSFFLQRKRSDVIDSFDRNFTFSTLPPVPDEYQLEENDNIYNAIIKNKIPLKRQYINDIGNDNKDNISNSLEIKESESSYEENASANLIDRLYNETSLETTKEKYNVESKEIDIALTSNNLVLNQITEIKEEKIYDKNEKRLSDIDIVPYKEIYDEIIEDIIPAKASALFNEKREKLFNSSRKIYNSQSSANDSIKSKISITSDDIIDDSIYNEIIPEDIDKVFFIGNSKQAFKEMTKSFHLGQYLIRKDNDRLILTVQCPTRIVKYILITDPTIDIIFIKGQNVSFNNLSDLLSYYQEYNVPNQNCKLTIPLEYNKKQLTC